MDVSFNLPKDKPQMVFISGGPGSGKDTQAAKLVRDLKFVHLSVGELMRAEVEKKSKEGQELQPILNKGDIVPSELTVRILVKEIKARNAKKYLINGFPRNLDQALCFEKEFREIDFILNLRCSDETMKDRLLKRAAVEGRYDDNEETINHRIQVFHEETEAALQFYARYGKVANVDGEGHVDQVYQRTLNALLPNLIFFYGPPATGQEELAEMFSHLAGYTLVKVNDFYRAKGISNATDEVKMDHLVGYLRDNHQRNFVLHNFPENIRQVKIFVEHFAAPKQFYYFDFSRDQVENYIKDFSKQQRQLALQEYDNYVKNRKDILAYFSKKAYFTRIQDNESKEVLWNNLAQHIAPEVIVCPDLPDDEFSHNYIKRLERERGYHYIDVVELVKDEVKRGIGLGKKLCESIQSGIGLSSNQQELVKRILFADFSKKKFILGGFPDRLHALEELEKNCCKVKNVMVFIHKPLKLSEDTIYAHYHAKGKLIKISGDHLDQFDDYVLNRCRYGFLFGPELAGKVAVLNHLKGRYATQVVDFNQTTEMLKVKLATEDNPDVEVKFQDILKYFTEELASKDRSHNVLFDGWPYEKEQLGVFLRTVGAPHYTFWLNASEEILGKRYMVENKAETVDEGEQEKINEEVAKTKQLAQVVLDYIHEGNNVNLYDIKVGLSTESTLKDINNIVYKRVFVLRNASTKQSNQNVKNLMVSACISNNITFIDVADLIEEHVSKNDDLSLKLQSETKMMQSKADRINASLFTPTLVTSLIKKRLEAQPPTKYVMLFNYPNAETKEHEDFYPRPIDELHQIETDIGPVRQVTSIQDTHQSYVIDDPLEERPVIEEVKKEEKPKAEGEEGEAEPEPPKEEEGEDTKPKFNPLEYEWTVSDGHPKSLAKIYHRRLNCEHNEYEIKSQNIAELTNILTDYIGRLEDSENKDRDYYVEIILKRHV